MITTHPLICAYRHNIEAVDCVNYITIFEGFWDKMGHIHFLSFSFYKLKQKMAIIPTTDNFCAMAHIKNVDTRGN